MARRKEEEAEEYSGTSRVRVVLPLCVLYIYASPKVLIVVVVLVCL